MSEVEQFSEILEKDQVGYSTNVEFYFNLDKLVGLSKKVSPSEAEQVFVQYRHGYLNNRSLFNKLVDVTETSLGNSKRLH
ncbi:hypothetical protein SP15_121 [Bacillus phage SP-15]|uniref:Uncharacterized protein n=1 Tax=Bacillus phage SP-15 TaxID=1792032 RepID=A0A127AW53_9CAUD|nr:hypothetical protein SP15_121 [Bacillus phage SP-15]AMM44919.1 hypothetical protein SP15_121 [Bacillus phage SP-15]